MLLDLDLQLFAGEKTEPATPRKRQEARKKGQVAKSNEVAMASLLLAGFALLPMAIARVFEEGARQLMEALRFGAMVDLTEGEAMVYLRQASMAYLGLAIPLLAGMALVGFLAHFLQVGVLFSPEAIKPKFEKINPLSGLKKIFSKRAVVELLKSMFKVGLIGFLVYRSFQSNWDRLLGLSELSVMAGAMEVGKLVVGMGMQVGLALGVLAALDYLYQRWEFENSLKMSKQEIKDEHKQTEGDPQLKSRIRQRQRQMAQSRMMANIPKADVVITNPTHYAVAIQYKEGTPAPVVVAKGRGYMAAKIRRLAQENQVPLVENPPLARALYAAVEIGESIPPELYKAVAEVLAFVYRLRRRNRA